MLRALAADAARIDGVEVVVMWAAGLEPFGVRGVEVIEVPGSPSPLGDAFDELFTKIAAESDSILSIAPEMDDLLAKRATASGDRWLGAQSTAVSVCGDKRRLDQTLTTAIRRPMRHEVIGGSILAQLPAVIKPKDGAGGSAFLFRTVEEFRSGIGAVLDEIGRGSDGDPIVQEDYIPGRPCSVAVINNTPLPTGVQDIRIDGSPGRLSYHGGTVPAADVDQNAVRRLVAQVYNAVPGLRGWWGIDFVIPEEPFEGSFDPVLIEVNPRLTTSYLGYRALTPDNLAERILFPERTFPPLRWRAGSVSFTKGGTLN